MRPGLHRAAADAAGGFPRAGLAVVFCAASFLLRSTAGEETVPAGSKWQLLLAFVLLAAGSLCLMRGMRLLDARRAPAIAVRWSAGDPDPELAVVVAAASFLLHSTAGGEMVPAGSEWQLLLAFALLAAGLLCLMHRMRLREARRAPAIAVRWNAGDPDPDLAVVVTAASFLLHSTAGSETVPARSEWQLLLAFALLAAGSLCLMHGMRLGDARRAPAIAVRWNAGDPDPDLAVVVTAASFLLHSTAGGLAFALLAACSLCLMHGMRLGDARRAPAIAVRWNAGDPDPDLAVVVTAASFLLHSTAGGLAFALLAACSLCLMHGMRLGDARRAPAIAVRWNAGDPDPDLAVVVTAASFLLHSTAGGLAFALLAACSLCLMHGMRLGDTLRAPAIAVRWNAGYPDPDLAVVVTAASFLLHSTAGGETVPARSEWQLLLAFALLVAGSLCLMHGMRLLDARRAPAIAVRWNAGDPDPDLAVVVTAASFLLHSTAGSETVPAGSEWQLLLAFALLAAGSLCLMHGMRLGDARRAPAIAVRWNAGDPDPDLAVVVTAASFLLHSTAGGETVPARSEWQLLLAFALLAAGSLCLMHGMRLRDARRAPAIAVRWNAGDPDPERLLP